MDIDKLFPALAKYHVVSESISGDGLSNVVKIERIYRVPWYAIRKDVIYNLHQYDRKEFQFDGVTVHSIAGGWADSRCHTVKLILQVVPNGGRIVYNDN